MILRRYLPAAGLLIAFVLIWQAVASLPGVDNLTLASPVETWHSLKVDHALLFSNMWVTLEEVALGL
ncbi:MAG TPA: hypothetical protein VJU60_08380, partial [Thermoleophilaceae bacterium]|nr:hypothetical protein [Thermoleophilaceae bacterium]